METNSVPKRMLSAQECTTLSQSYLQGFLLLHADRLSSRPVHRELPLLFLQLKLKSKVSRKLGRYMCVCVYMCDHHITSSHDLHDRSINCFDQLSSKSQKWMIREASLILLWFFKVFQEGEEYLRGDQTPKVSSLFSLSVLDDQEERENGGSFTSEGSWNRVQRTSDSSWQTRLRATDGRLGFCGHGRHSVSCFLFFTFVVELQIA